MPLFGFSIHWVDVTILCPVQYVRTFFLFICYSIAFLYFLVSKGSYIGHSPGSDRSTFWLSLLQEWELRLVWDFLTHSRTHIRVLMYVKYYWLHCRERYRSYEGLDGVGRSGPRRILAGYHRQIYRDYARNYLLERDTSFVTPAGLLLPGSCRKKRLTSGRTSQLLWTRSLPRSRRERRAATAFAKITATNRGRQRGAPGHAENCRGRKYETFVYEKI